MVSHHDYFLFSGVEVEGMGEGAMVEEEEDMEVEGTDQSRTLTSRLRLTSTTVVSLTHLAEGPTKVTVRTRGRERELGLVGGSCCVPSAYIAGIGSVLLPLPASSLPLTARK